MADINKSLLEHLANLSRIELSSDEEERFLGDLEKILSHFKELEEVNTDNVSPMTGGTSLKNSFRNDGDRDLASELVDRENIKKAFPETDKGFLKVPKVFD